MLLVEEEWTLNLGGKKQQKCDKSVYNFVTSDKILQIPEACFSLILNWNK